jgi:hypothetical protein
MNLHSHVEIAFQDSRHMIAVTHSRDSAFAGFPAPRRRRIVSGRFPLSTGVALVEDSATR